MSEAAGETSGLLAWKNPFGYGSNKTLQQTIIEVSYHAQYEGSPNNCILRDSVLWTLLYHEVPLITSFDVAGRG